MNLFDEADDSPAPRRKNELPADAATLERRRALARAVDCAIAEDLNALGGLKPSTSEAWAKRGQGPDYVMFGNERLYPLESLRKFLREKVRTRNAATSHGVL